jgi:hypothetical protein
MPSTGGLTKHPYRNRQKTLLKKNELKNYEYRVPTGLSGYPCAKSTSTTYNRSNNAPKIPLDEGRAFIHDVS